MSTWRERALVGAGALVLAFYPLVLAGGVVWRDVPAVLDGQDPMIQVSILQQVLHRVPLGLEAWQAPFLWPGEFSLAYMDPLLGQSFLVAWIPWAHSHPALAYNLALVLTLALAGAFTYALARALGANLPAAAVAAVAYVVSPYAAGHLQHLNQLPSPWLPLAVWGIVRLTDGRWRGAWALSIALLLQLIGGIYYTVALVLVIGCVLMTTARRMPARGWIGAGIALAVFAVALWVWSLPYRAAMEGVSGFTREATAGGPYAARVFDYWHAAPAHLLPWPTTAVARPVLYPSLVLVGLAAVGVLRWMPRTMGEAAGHRAVMAGLVLASAVGVILAFGRTLPVPGLASEVPMPWAWLQDHLWPLRAIRAPARLFLPATLTLGLLAAVPLGTLLSRRSLTGFALLGLALLDLAPGPVDRVRVEPSAEEREVLAYLTSLPPKTPWAVLPMPERDQDETVHDARQMLWAVLSQRPLAGGSSGFVPPSLAALREDCADSDCEGPLRAIGVQRVFSREPVAWSGTTTLDRVGPWYVYSLNPGSPAN